MSDKQVDFRELDKFVYKSRRRANLIDTESIIKKISEELDINEREVEKVVNGFHKFVISELKKEEYRPIKLPFIGILYKGKKWRFTKKK